MSRQLALPLTSEATPTLESFVPGANAEALARLRALVAGRLAEGQVYLWGAPGSGKTHLVRACVAARPGLLAADDVQALDDEAQRALFCAILEAREAGEPVLVAGAAPPAVLPLRSDLASRLAQGLVYRLHPLGDEERRAYVFAEARRRGLALGDEVVAYLLSRARRDPASLAALLERLDRLSLERGRPVSVGLVREALAGDVPQ